MQAIENTWLDSYQTEGVQFLVDTKRAILADDVGLGKTAQAIHAALRIGASRVLVVTKKSLVYNWKHEIRRWAGEEGVILTTKSVLDVPNRFVLTNYETVVRRIDALLEQHWDALIVDEAAYVKNRKAKRSITIFKLAQTIPYVWLLTATPMPNNVAELWSLLHILDRKKYTSYWRFVDQYCWTEPNFFGGKTFLPGIKDEVGFQREIAPIMLRRTKELLNLPPVSYETIYVEQTGEQQRIYRDLKKSFLSIIDDTHYVMAPTALAQLTRLRQVVCSPALVGGKDDSAKTDALIELLEELAAQHKILVFTTFAEYVKLLLPELTPFGAVSITGEHSQEQRLKATETFQADDKCRVLVGTIGAMGEGLNLQSADVVVFLNKDWVPSNNLIQAVGRAHRRGQTKPVHVISLITKGTVDEYVEEALEAKLVTHQAFEAIIKRLREEDK
ncbi:DEAD/DEAH box helicase [Gelria sp. Kuro-4]|uniref:DEAD/DEAH box helicase n=1 Tax=Gelria sp. Kuro-4 TaxID=2796927 RepID=UPI001BF09252|nr:DEAD/DEAH box helicase [Gelria sp. Kuro-4]BCV23334.1 hypothetical protein kuro4_01070 [Gelria sp. Kuro-4]